VADFSSGYAVRDVEGLDPVTATLTTSSIAQQDGAQPQNDRRDTRNITMKLGLSPDYAKNTVRSLRSALYDYLMPKANIVLGFYFDSVLFATSAGQVESFENTLFSADPEVDISIICYDPDFYGPDPVVTSDTSKAGTAVPIVIGYDGTSDAGVVFTLAVDRDLTEVVISNTTPDGVLQKMTLDGTFVAGDIVTINTIPGSKAVTLTRGAITTSALSGLDSTSSWIALKKGDNSFRVITAEDGVPFTMTFTPQYGGL
jgi:hypothetical protein